MQPTSIQDFQQQQQQQEEEEISKILRPGIVANFIYKIPLSPTTTFATTDTTTIGTKPSFTIPTLPSQQDYPTTQTETRPSLTISQDYYLTIKTSQKIVSTPTHSPKNSTSR
ncbi:hypothetical protein C1646_753200 [Rhizophagus diaphanus]|nr:hypothetical protein C1646_753200 [Rhizophagus diaphanus] [Rhizophagus sp. MUCL 43196]